MVYSLFLFEKLKDSESPQTFEPLMNPKDGLFCAGYMQKSDESTKKRTQEG